MKLLRQLRQDAAQCARQIGQLHERVVDRLARLSFDSLEVLESVGAGSGLPLIGYSMKLASDGNRTAALITGITGAALFATLHYASLARKRKLAGLAVDSP